MVVGPRALKGILRRRSGRTVLYASSSRVVAWFVACVLSYSSRMLHHVSFLLCVRGDSW